MKTKTVPGFDQIGGRAIMCMHTFSVARDGQLQHEIDGVLRATVPPEGWLDYIKTYPEAQDIVDELTKPTPAAPAVAPEAQAEPAPSIQDQLAAVLAKVQELQAAQAAQEQPAA